MTCDNYSEEFELYALGLLEPDEQAEMGAHLNTGCETCQAPLRRALVLNSMIMRSVNELAPRRSLRSAVLRTLTGRDHSPAWAFIWAGLATGLLTLTVWMGNRNHEREQQLADARHQLESQKVRSARIQQALAVLSDPGTRLATAGQEEVQPRASYFLNPKRGVVMIGAHLTGLDPAHVYQMWIIPKGQNPKPAGLFRPDDAGNAVHLFETQLAPGTTAALALSVEPEAGSAAPTTTPILVAPVTGD
ncbi:anti-sigma factor [uncultured Paludibaculum sp.]|uniref:anti-sigma factor n=1 Tax=uncultured Paludibaculum sp. TaxID=1765020 RepID=UPI002AAA84C0|nr:anti-sigma factor [uncultured Paludibaculum sp.]